MFVVQGTVILEGREKLTCQKIYLAKFAITTDLIFHQNETVAIFLTSR
jgi:hypothetical protein